MPFCPNTGCPPRARTGRPAEYRPGITHCADCGTELVDDDPSPRRARRSTPPMPSALKRRLLATVGICLALYGLSWLPHPGLDPDGVAELTGAGEISRRHLGPLGLGVTPLLVGFVLVELFALVVPALRRRRLGDPKLRAGLTRAALITGALVALLQGISQAMWMEGVGYQFGGGYGPSLVVDYGWAFRLETGLLMLTGTALFAAGAWAIDRFGLGRGYAVLLLAGVAFELPAALSKVWRVVASGTLTVFAVGLAAVVLVAAVLGLLLFFRQTDRKVGRAPIRLPVCGTFPLELAVLIGTLPATLSMFIDWVWLEWLAMRLVPGSLEWFGLQVGMVALVAVPISTLFYWRRRRLLADPDHRRFWWTARLASIGLLLGMATADTLFSTGGPVSLYVLWPGALTVVIVVALAVDLWTEVRARWAAPGGVDLEAVEIHQDLSDALASARVYAATQPDQPVTVTGLRFRSLAYFFAPYAPIVLLGPPGTKPREPFPGGENLEDVELARQFE